MPLKDDRLICTEYIPGERGTHLNAVIETLALVLFQDAERGRVYLPSDKDFRPRCWHELTHEQRQHFREVAQGRAYLGW
jgi:hypothetical protein